MPNSNKQNMCAKIRSFFSSKKKACDSAIELKKKFRNSEKFYTLSSKLKSSKNFASVIGSCYDTELYELKTVYWSLPPIQWKNYLPPRRSRINPDCYPTNAMYNIEKLIDLYKNICLQFKQGPFCCGRITKDESILLGLINQEFLHDRLIISSYSHNKEKVIKTNHFMGNHFPFNEDFYDNLVESFKTIHPEGVSQSFLAEISIITDECLNFCQKIIKDIQIAFEGLEPACLERAFAYADVAPIKIKKGYRDAIDGFADELSAYAEMNIGAVKCGEIIGKEEIKEYAFSYLNRIQECLKQHGFLTLELIETLYFEASKKKDVEIQKALLRLVDGLSS